MARSGTQVHEVIDARGLDTAVVIERLLGVVGDDYRPVRVGAMQYRFARSYRPAWSLVAGCVLLPVLVGVPLLLYKRSETWDATVQEGHTGVRVQVTGTVLAETIIGLRDALRGRRPPRPGPVSVAPAAERAAPSPVPAVAPAVPAGAPAPPGPGAPPVTPEGVAPAKPAAPEAVPDDRTVLAREVHRQRSASVGTDLVLSFDTGETHRLTGVVIVGRDPSAAAGDGDAALVPVTDPDFSVSKTHVSLAPDGRGGVVVADRGSTNGTAVEDERGNLSPVVSGVPVTARPGQTVRFGKRAVLISEERV